VSAGPVFFRSTTRSTNVKNAAPRTRRDQRAAEIATGVPARMQVYFVRASNGMIKIGKSKHPNARVAELQVGCPLHLRLMASYVFDDLPDSIRANLSEKSLQRAFKSSWVRGEWFRPTAALRAFIAQIRRNARRTERP
jgi:hypothetical protein